MSTYSLVPRLLALALALAQPVSPFTNMRN